MAKSKRNGIACTGLWVPIPLEFLRSRACAELSSLGCKLFFDCLTLLGPNASGNGDISLAPKSMAVRGWVSRASLGSAVKELVNHGLLVRTRHGSRLDCSLFAISLYPLDCDPKKIDVGPGSYRQADYMGRDALLAKPPTEMDPATWRRARQLMCQINSVAPPRNEVPTVRSATVQTPPKK